MKKIVVIGNGFAGMWAALVAGHEADKHRVEVSITLIAPEPYLTVRPRLYEAFSEEIRAALDPVLTPLNIRMQLGHVQHINTRERRVNVESEAGGPRDISYDKLILAAGSVQRSLSIPGEKQHTHSIDTFALAKAFDQHLKKVLRPPASDAALTFVIVGAGFTGIELATEMRTRIKGHSDAETAARARVILIEKAATVGHELGPNPRPVIEDALKHTGVECRLNTQVDEITADRVTLSTGERIETRTVIMTTGLQANPLASTLKLETDRQGRVLVDEYLRVKGLEDVFAAGDIASAQADAEHLTLMSCQHAVPMGKHAGFNALHALTGQTLRTYSQPYYVTYLDLGGYGAVSTMGWERKVEQAGAEVKALKRTVNTQWIYPPTGTRAEILAATGIDAQWPPEK